MLQSGSHAAKPRNALEMEEYDIKNQSGSSGSQQRLRQRLAPATAVSSLGAPAAVVAAASAASRPQQ